MRALVIAALISLSVPIALPVSAQAQEQVDPAISRIVTAMQIGPMMEVMHDEGLAYGDDLAADMLGGQSDRWSAIVARIYDKAAMEAAFTTRFAEELTGAAELADIEAFFASEAGQKIVTLEIEARRAMLDEAVEDAAKVLMQDMVANEDARLQMLQDFVAAGDLEEQNVVGAMNANFAFMQGMAAAGGPAAQMTEEDMLADVWGREGEVRASTREWLYSYFALAYQPLEDRELQDYTDFWASAAGKRANTALFAAFDQVFTDISRELGRAAAVQIQGDDI